MFFSVIFLVVLDKICTFAAMREELEEKVKQSKLLIRHAYRHATWQGKKWEHDRDGKTAKEFLEEYFSISLENL